MNGKRDTRTASILIVDDNDMNRDLLTRRLERKGFSCVIAESGRQAIDLIENEPVDLVLLDVEMPVMSGIDVLKILRQTHSPTQLPVIMVTARNQSADIVQALSLGANDYVTKPIDFAVAVARIETQLAYMKAQKELSFHETLLKCQTEASLDGILLVSQEGEWLSYNQRFLEMWEIPPHLFEDWTQESALKWMMAKVVDSEALMVTLIRLDEQRDEKSWQEVGLKDGRTFDCYSAPIEDMENVHYGRVWYYRDITKRKWAEEAQAEAEAALRESEERYALAARGSNDGLWDWNLKTNEIYYSPRWNAMCGCEGPEIGNQLDHWYRRVHPDDLDRVKEAMNAHLQALAPHFEIEHRMLHQNGSYRWMLCRGMAVRDAQGRATRMAGSLTDITGGKLADPLTGLPNRLLFVDRLEQAIRRRTRRKDYLFAVFFLDLDRFKMVNDSFGHVIGDQLLIAVARRFGICLRNLDTIARYEEALISPFDLSGNEVFTTASIGIAVSASGYQRPEELLRDADTAMYRAKSLGKARYELFDPAMRDQAVTRMQLETDLRRAIDRGELRNFYQPIVCLKTGEIVGFEALVRWQHPERGLVPPGEFIPMAEETGLILPLGQFVLREACQQMHAWQEHFQDAAPGLMSVNFSIRQFQQPDFIQQIKLLLLETGLDVSQLKIEITESFMMDNVSSASTVLSQLKELGFRLSLDDFGTGYSSLSYLHRFPIDTLKIDRSFVSPTGSKKEKSPIVGAIVMLARSLNMDVVAEGVETIEQLADLRELGCEYGQGYYFSRPVDPEAATRLIAEQKQMPATPRLLSM